MIAVEEALRLIDKNVQNTDKIISLPISKAQGCILAKDVMSMIDMPPFRQSAMDGYALGSIEENSFELIGEIQAGDHKNPKLERGVATRIFTGAPVPSTAMAVIMQEKTKVLDGKLVLEEQAKVDSNIRPVGEQVKKGDIALAAKTLLTPAGIGYLASIGVTHIDVFQKPSIALITTGNELVPPGQKLKHGQIYESNSVMLLTALEASGYPDVSCFKVEDDYDLTYDLLQNTIEHYDMVLISGGISVGDYDFVGKALKALDVDEIFYKVKQKPGKPLFFAKKANATIFALPGNPASSLSCFYLYALPTLFKMSGNPEYHLKREVAIADFYYKKKGQRAEFLKAIVKGGKVTLLDGQASSMLRSFALANALIYLSEETIEVQPQDEVQVILLPS
ncbi:gephyrin-like molybdotransferase Glp [Aquimarina sp. 2201CG1-2-11]|uniref:molybdopterin molybdotransferase MoeA n=1 Tax=Aquimarina discodermiae TaxID=3231043 RepID=UPI00346295D3